MAHKKTCTQELVSHRKDFTKTETDRSPSLRGDAWKGRAAINWKILFLKPHCRLEHELGLAAAWLLQFLLRWVCHARSAPVGAASAEPCSGAVAVPANPKPKHTPMILSVLKTSQTVITVLSHR